MSERSRFINVKVRVDKEGNTEVFKDISEDVGALAPTAKEARVAMDKLGDSVENNFRGSYRATTNARFALDEYRQKLKQLQDAGAHVPEEQLEKLRELEGRYESLIDQVGKYRAANKRTADDVRDATAAAGGYTRGLTDLGDVTDALGGKFAKYGGIVAAVIATFTAAYKGTRKFVGAMKELGVDIDAIVQKTTPLIQIAEQLNKVWVGTADTSMQLKNQMRVLAANGIDVAGKSAEEVGKLYEEFTKKLRENATEVASTTAAYEKWRAELGPTTEELDKTAAALEDNIEKLLETEENLTATKFAALVKPQVDALVAQYNRLGEEPPEKIRLLKEELDRLAAASGEAAEDMASQWGTTKEEIQAAVDELRAAFEPIPDDLAKQAEAVGVNVNAWEKHNKIWTATPSKAKEAGDAAREAGEAAGEGAEGLGEQAEAAKEAAGGLGGAATATGDLTSKQNAAQEELAKTTQKLSEMAALAEDDLAGLADLIANAFSGAEGFGAPIVAEIESIVAAAERAKTAVTALKTATE